MIAFRALVLLSLCAGLAAQTTVKVTGTVYDGNGGPFVKGKVYWVYSGKTSGIQVPKGKTLTVQPGAIVKFDGNALQVDGTLNCLNATFTSIKDDLAGGDTNGDGAKTKPQASDWTGIKFTTTGPAIGRMLSSTIKYCGLHGAEALFFERKTESYLDGVTISECTGNGLHTFASRGWVRGCNIQKCRVPIVCYEESIGLLSGNKASGNAVTDHLTYASKALPARMSKPMSLNNNGVVILGFSVDINKPTVIDAGVILKLERQTVNVANKLECKGTAASPVVWTSLFDDARGGKSIKRSTSKAAAGDWSSFVINGSSPMFDVSLVHTQILYGGSATAALLTRGPARVKLDNVDIADSASAGLRNTASVIDFKMTNCDISDCKGAAVEQFPLDSLPFCRKNTTRNTAQNHFQVRAGLLRGSVAIRPDNYPGNHFIVTDDIVVGSTAKLTLRPGVFIGMRRGRIQVAGQLEILGSPSRPVLLTSEKDTPKGKPAPGDWGGISIEAKAGKCKLHNAVIRYSTNGMLLKSSGHDVRGVRVSKVLSTGCSVEVDFGKIDSCSFTDCGFAGINVRGKAEVVNCTVANCKTAGVRKDFTNKGCTVSNSIAWNCGTNLSGFQAPEVFSTCGGFAGKNGNINVDPQFDGPDFGLKPTSPCINSASLARLGMSSMDGIGSSRALDGLFNGKALPDMGAFEYSSYKAKVSGEDRLGNVLTCRIDGPSGLAVWILGGGKGAVYVPPLGHLNAGLGFFFVLGASATGNDYKFAIPSSSSFRGFEVSLQGLALPTAKPGFGNLLGTFRLRFD